MNRVLLLAFVITITIVSRLDAQVLVNQWPPTANEAEALRSNMPSPEFGEPSQQVADNFQLTSSASLSDLRWAGFYGAAGVPGSSTTVSFTVRLFTGTTVPASVPFYSQLIAATCTNIGSGSLNDPLYQFNATLPTPVSLSGGQTYWLSVLDSDTATTFDFRWLDTSQIFDDLSAFRDGDAGTWSAQQDGDYAFSLAAVPEPSTIALLVLGGIGLLTRRRR
jgi:PEP-CTERM motif